MVLTGGSTAHFPEKQLVHGTKGFIFRVGIGFEVFLSFFLGFL